MELWIVIVLYVFGLGLIIAEAMMPGVVMGLIGATALITSIVFGMRHHWLLGTSQITLAVVVTPLSIWWGVRRMALRTALDQAASFAQDYGAFTGKEGEAITDLRPAGMVLIEGRRVDVVTAGEPVEKGRRVRVAKVEGNRIVVRAI